MFCLAIGLFRLLGIQCANMLLGRGSVCSAKCGDERPRRDRRYTQCALTCARGLDGPTPCECVANLCVLQLYDEQMCSACKFASYLYARDAFAASFKNLFSKKNCGEDSDCAI